MTRLVFTYVVPLVLPLLGWYLWRTLAQRPSGQPRTKPSLTEAPWPLLGGVGVVLLGLTLGAYALLTGGAPGDVYSPAALVDGKVVPGHSEAVKPGGG